MKSVFEFSRDENEIKTPQTLHTLAHLYFLSKMRKREKEEEEEKEIE